jgi:hypothetical protein
MPPENNFFSSLGFGKNKAVAGNTNDPNKGKLDSSGKPIQNKQGSENNTGIEGIEDPNNKNIKNAKSPFDDFSNLFDTPADDGKKNLPPSLSISPDKLKEHVSKLDFTSDIPQETRQALVNMGDQGKVFLDLLNHVGRQAYSTAVQHNAALTDKFVGMRSEFDGKSLSGRVKSELVRSGFHKSNSHPVVTAAQEMIARQLQVTNPDATPEWIQEKTNSFFTLLGQQLDPNANKDEDSDAPSKGDVDWLEFAGVKKPSKEAIQ